MLCYAKRFEQNRLCVQKSSKNSTFNIKNSKFIIFLQCKHFSLKKKSFKIDWKLCFMLWYVITNETSMICYEIVRYWMKFQWYSRRFQCCVTVFVGKYILDAYTVMLMFHWIFRFSFLTIFRSWLLWNSSKFSKKIKAQNQAITAKKKCFW